MGTVYTVGYQPIDIVSRSHKLVDIMSAVIEKGVPSNNLTEEVIKYLRAFDAGDEDFLLLNTCATKDLIPYCKFKNTLVYDPPYVANSGEVLRLLRQLSTIIGEQNTNNLYLHPLNYLKALIEQAKDKIPQSLYYNLLNLLTDANKSDTQAMENHILRFADKVKGNFDKYAIFLGDRIDPSFFDYLNSKGVYVLKFLPYEFFSLPSPTVDAAYHANPFFQYPLSKLIELKQVIFGTQMLIKEQEVHPSMLILNPGGIYLSKSECDYYVTELASSIPTYVLPGVYKGATLAI